MHARRPATTFVQTKRRPTASDATKLCLLSLLHRFRHNLLLNSAAATRLSIPRQRLDKDEASIDIGEVEGTVIMHNCAHVPVSVCTARIAEAHAPSNIIPIPISIATRSSWTACSLASSQPVDQYLKHQPYRPTLSKPSAARNSTAPLLRNVKSNQEYHPSFPTRLSVVHALNKAGTSIITRRFNAE